jgi:hypothetical protein
MPATTLWIVQNEDEHRLMFITQQYGENDFTVNIYHCNEDFIPFGEPVTKDIIGKEEDYHKSLRKDSSDKGHYVPGHSTNPEWNPGYVEPQQETGGHYGC